MKSLAVAFAAACLIAALPVLAADPTPAPSPAAGSPAPSPTPRAWVTTGFVDTTYSAVATSRSFQFASGANARVFDLYDRQPTLNALDLQLIHNAPIGGKVELTLGSDADVLASWPAANFSSVDVTNAYLSATSGAFTLSAGKFSTLAGAEVLESPSNADISRSILFGYAIPFTHTGARLTYAVTSTLSAIAGINNGWDNTKGNGSGAKTVEGGLAYTNKNLSLTTQGYSGTEQTAYGYRDSIIDVNGIPGNWSGRDRPATADRRGRDLQSGSRHDVRSELRQRQPGECDLARRERRAATRRLRRSADRHGDVERRGRIRRRRVELEAHAERTLRVLARRFRVSHRLRATLE